MADPKKIKLIVSEHKPTKGAEAHELQVSMVDEHLQPAKPVGARLCGGTSTCIAIVETE
jgi:hypothetical protein